MSEDWTSPTSERVLMAIDPGEVHVGVAVFVGGECVDAFEETPHGAITLVHDLLVARRLHTLVCEQFRLYPWMAEQQAFSDFKTVELIGVLRYLWAMHGALDDGATLNKGGREVGTTYEWVTWVENPATIKNPTRAILKTKKIPQVSKRLKAGGHAADAELHGHHYLMSQAGTIKDRGRGRGGSVAQVETQASPKVEKITVRGASVTKGKRAPRKIGAAAVARKKPTKRARKAGT